MQEFKNVSIQPLSATLLSNSQIKISKRLFESMGLKENHSLHLQCGKQITTIKPISVEENSTNLYLSEALLEELYIPITTIKLCLHFDPKSSTLYIGPIIAALIQLNKDPSSHILNSFLQELTLFSNSVNAFFYIFSVTGWEEDYVNGYRYENNEWIKIKAPVPDVIYNRIHSRLYERSNRIQQLFSHFQKINIPYFNDHFLNKWEVFQLLLEFDYISPYLPETELMDGIGVLSKIIEKHSTVFIKPIHGSQGKDIYRIKKITDDHFTIDYSSFHGDVDKTFSSLASLYQSLRERLKKQRFIIQQGISLLAHEQRPLDFRVLCHRDTSGEWKVTSSVARVSTKDNFVSNLSKGGELFKLTQILPESFDSKTAKQIQKALLELAVECASLISQETEGLFGELGIDLAIDETGHPWIIEVNTKPSKNLDNSPTKIRPSSKAIIKYGFYLYRKMN